MLLKKFNPAREQNSQMASKMILHLATLSYQKARVFSTDLINASQTQSLYYIRLGEYTKVKLATLGRFELPFMP